MRKHGFTGSAAVLAAFTFFGCVNSSPSPETSSGGNSLTSTSTSDTDTGSTGTGGGDTTSSTSNTGGTTASGGSGAGGHGQGGDGGTTSTSNTGGSAGSGGAGGVTTSSDPGTGGHGSAGQGGHGSAGPGGAGGASTSSSSSGTGGAGSAGTGGGDAGVQCDPSQKKCGDACVSDLDPAFGCSDNVCTPCSLANATAKCVSKACAVDVCNPGKGNCDGNSTNGCEVTLTNDVANCGSCGNACPVPANAVNASCANSTCAFTCAAGFADCDVQPANGCETDTKWSNANCGACGKSCNATEVCTSGACVSTLTPFSCSGWTRDLAFDKVKLNGQDLEDVGGIFGFSSNELFVAAGSNQAGTVVHWANGAWSLVPLADDTWMANDIAGTSADDFWVAARSWSLSWTVGQMFHCLKGICVQDQNQPAAASFNHVVVTPSGTFVHGFKMFEKDHVWRRNANGTWSDLNGPWGSKVSLGQLSYIGGKLFVPGVLFDENGIEKQALLYTYDESGWVSKQVPADAVVFGIVSGTSLNDLFIAGAAANNATRVWRLTDLMSTWTVATQGSVGTVLSIYAGTFIAAGYKPPAVAGSLRITTGDQLSAPQTVAVDQLGYNPSVIWKDPQSSAVKIAHAATGGTIAGIYTGSCK